VIALPADALCGSLPPLVTPFRDDAIDTGAYEQLVRFHIQRGSHGIVVCGTSGEPSALDLDERRRLLETALMTADGQIPVVAAVGSQSLAETQELVEHATRMRADALLVVTPYYIRPPQRGLVEYFVEVCRNTDLPVLLYHIPGRAAVAVELETLVRIATRAENFVGMKHAVADLGLVTDALRELGPEFRVHVGLEELSFPMLAIGAAGMINAVANVSPERVAALYEAVRDGKLEEGRRLHFELWDLNRSVFFETNPIPIKYMMRRLGILATNEHRLPMVPASPDTEARCDAILRGYGLLAGD
jgi:4-hydroxy-tetrahydrodipicolinate synthase